MNTQTSVAPTETFPAKAVEDCLREALVNQHETQQLLRPQAASACEPEVDSLVVIELMCAIEQLLGVVLPTSFVPRGGYDDVDACVADLVAQTHTVWVELVKQVEEHHV